MEGSVQHRLRVTLALNRSRVIDLFRAWDADNSGRIDKFEFRKAVRTLGFEEAQEDVDAVFDSFDDMSDRVRSCGQPRYLRDQHSVLGQAS